MKRSENWEKGEGTGREGGGNLTGRKGVGTGRKRWELGETEVRT